MVRSKKFIGCVGVNAYKERARKPYKKYKENAENAQICLTCDKRSCKGDCERVHKRDVKIRAE